jgi:hypothetical protein
MHGDRRSTALYHAFKLADAQHVGGENQYGEHEAAESEQNT